jgi:hypothetical protein
MRGRDQVRGARHPHVRPCVPALEVKHEVFAEHYTREGELPNEDTRPKASAAATPGLQADGRLAAVKG